MDIKQPQIYKEPKSAFEQIAIDANNVMFSNGKTFQKAYDDGDFIGPKGATGDKLELDEIINVRNVEYDVMASAELQNLGNNKYRLTLYIPKGKTGDPPTILEEVNTVTVTPDTPASAQVIEVEQNTYQLFLRIPKGDTGNEGVSPTLNTTVQVTTLAPGSSANARLQRSGNMYTLILGIPRGEKGEAASIPVDNQISDVSENPVQSKAIKTYIDQQDSLKVDKTEGKGLSTNDFTNDLKYKLEHIEAESNKIIIDDTVSDISANPVQNRVIKFYIDRVITLLKDNVVPELDTLRKIAEAINNDPSYHSTAKTYVDTCITNLINGAPANRDTLKELSDALDQAVNNIVDGAPSDLNTLRKIAAAINNDKNFHQTMKNYVDQSIVNLINGAPAALDTLYELAKAMNDDPNFSQTMVNSLATKLDKVGTGDKLNAAAESAHKFYTARNIDGVSFNGTTNIVHYAISNVSAGTVDKTATCTGFSLTDGSEINVWIVNTNTAANPTLNVSGTGAKAMYDANGTRITGSYLTAGMYRFVYYNGGYYQARVPRAINADRLTTDRNFQIDLAKTSAVAFNGTANVEPGVKNTLAISNGGTSMTSNPSILVNVGSTSATNVFQTSPRPGVTGVLAIANGGTGSNSLENVNVKSATQLQNSRTILIDLSKTTSASFNGTANVEPGVKSTLAITNGGTGMTANPSILVNLESTNAVNTFQASPRPGVTGILPVARGGTGANSLANITAGKATNDSAGQTITSTYIKGLSVSGQTLTLTKGDGTTSTITTQDTHHQASIAIGASNTTTNATTTNGNTYLKIIENGSKRSAHKIVGSGATSVTSDSSGNITISSTNTTYSAGTGINITNGTIKCTVTNTDTHHQATLITANSNTATSQNTTNSTNATTYLNLIENSTKRSSIKITGSGGTTVSSNGGTITINSTSAAGGDTVNVSVTAVSGGVQVSLV